MGTYMIPSLSLGSTPNMFDNGWNFLTWNLNTYEFTSYKGFIPANYLSTSTATRSNGDYHECYIGGKVTGGGTGSSQNFYGFIHTVAWENADLDRATIEANWFTHSKPASLTF
jgi:hypothetical protein